MKDDLDYFRELKALEEYRAIGTVEEFKDLKELRTAQKVNVCVHPVYESKSYHCPKCEANITGMGFDVCVECGQKLDWGD